MRESEKAREKQGEVQFLKRKEERGRSQTSLLNCFQGKASVVHWVKMLWKLFSVER